MAKEIYKIQRPLMSTVDMFTLLAYNKDRSNTLEIRMRPEEVEALFGDEYKIFCECTFVANTLEIGNKVEWQEW